MSLDVGLIATLGLAGLGGLWSLATLASSLRTSIRLHDETLKDIAKNVAKIPVVEAEIEQVKDVLSKHVSLFPKFSSRLSVVEDQLQSHREFRRQMQSSRDWKGEEK